MTSKKKHVKNLSAYDTILKEALARVDAAAKEFIPRLYRELIEIERLDPHDAGERIRKDLVVKYSRDTIYENLPEEAKQEGRGRPKNKDIEESFRKSETILLEQSSSGTQQTTESMTPTPIESPTQPPPSLPPSSPTPPLPQPIITKTRMIDLRVTWGNVVWLYNLAIKTRNNADYIITYNLETSTVTNITHQPKSTKKQQD